MKTLQKCFEEAGSKFPFTVRWKNPGFGEKVITFTSKKVNQYGTVQWENDAMVHNGWAHQPDYELVTGWNLPLEDLVAMVNSGLDALKQIFDLNPANVGWKSSPYNTFLRPGPWNGLLDDRLEIRLPAFVPFKADAWEVKLGDDPRNLYIGCQTFDRGNTQKGLRALCRESASTWSDGGPSFKLFATRMGIKYGSELLSWEGAEKLLTVLEEAFPSREDKAKEQSQSAKFGAYERGKIE